MAFFDDSLIAHLIHSFGVRIQRKGQRLVGEMLLKGYRRLPASLRHWGFDLYGGSSGIEGHPLHFAFFSRPPPVHLNMIYTNQIKIDTGQRTTDQLIARRLMLRINSLVIFQFTACIAWVVQGLVFFLWEPFILGMISWHTSWRYYSVEPIDSDKKIKKINRSYVCKTEIWGWKDK